MATVTASRSRTIVVTAGNLRQNHVYVREHYDFFPPDLIRPTERSDGGPPEIQLELAGLNETVSTGIAMDARTGKPRGFLRCRGVIRRFYEHHQVAEGEHLNLERLGRRRYRLSLDSNSQKPNGLRAAEFFAGIGLVRIALEQCGGSVVFANDIEESKAEMYRHNWPDDDHLVVDDIHNLKAADIPDCDLFTASFPCNDLSIAGRWEGLNGKESSAFWGFIDILRDLGDRRPPFVMLENVVGFLMRHGGQDLEQALLALNKVGYAVDAVILNAKHWTPQSRARLFIVGRQSTGGIKHSFALTSDARPAALTHFIAEHPEINWDLRELPPLPRHSPQLVGILEDLPDDHPDWWSADRVDYFMNQLSERHAAAAQEMILGKSFSYATAFRRVRHGRSMAELRTDGIAGCLRTPRGGSGRQILFKAGLGKRQVRLLTARECARLQGVPDSYRINVRLNQALFGFGDAVCVPAVEWVVEKLVMPVYFRLS